MIRQSTDLMEMLKQDLELEREALAGYMQAWSSCDEEDLPTKFWLEGQIARNSNTSKTLKNNFREKSKVNSDALFYAKLANYNFS
jgi:bacterioferritin (cytochrome b1)